MMVEAVHEYPEPCSYTREFKATSRDRGGPRSLPGDSTHVHCPMRSSYLAGNLTPISTPTWANVGERWCTIGVKNRACERGLCAWADISEQKESGSKTAGCRFDSCPTCPAQTLK